MDRASPSTSTARRSSDGDGTGIGVDLSAPQLTIVYDGPDRIRSPARPTITDLVRTGDFENVLSWAAGATEKVPFRVLTLKNPTRIVVDLETP